jgi:hypothetical protein
MGKMTNALKNLGKAINGVEPQGKYITDIINNIAAGYKGVAILEVSNITTLTTAQLNALKAGDVVIKNESGNKHTYVVSYKENNVGICLTYVDATVAETVSYDYTNNAWVYNSTDITPLTNN